MIVVLRIGHRIERDKRISTHVGLVARAFGAEKIVYSGDRDGKLLAGLRDVSKNWGGGFEAEYKPWKKVVGGWKGKIVHLTMYGEKLRKKIKQVRGWKEDLLVVVGGEKVPPEIYGVADANIAVTNQPHSEVAALAVFLDWYADGKELEKKFNGKLRIEPKSKGKSVHSCRK